MNHSDHTQSTEMIDKRAPHTHTKVAYVRKSTKAVHA